MGRRTKIKKNKLRVRCHLQGRVLKGKKEVKALSDGWFIYKGKLYQIEDFDIEGTVNVINLDKTKVSHYGKYRPPKKEHPKKKKRKTFKKRYAACQYSNIKECPDVKNLLEEGY